MCRSSRMYLPVPNRNRHVPDRNSVFPISCNIGFVFPSGFPTPAPALAAILAHKIQLWGQLRCFPNRSSSFSSLVTNGIRACRGLARISP
jgi:hypothetical protein